MNEINWKPLVKELNLSATSLSPGHYYTGAPNLGWVLYNRDGRGSWNQQTERKFAPKPGLIPTRIDDKWFWMPESPKEISYEVRSEKNVTLESPRMIEDARESRDLYARNNHNNKYTI